VPRDGNCQYVVTLVEAGIPAAVAILAMLVWAAWVAGAAAKATGDARLAALTAAIVGWSAAGLFCVFFSRGTGVWLGVLYGAAMALRPPARPRLTRRFLVPATVVVGSLLLAVLGAQGVGVDPGVSRATPSTLDKRLRVVTLPDDLDTTGRLLRVEAETAGDLIAPFMVVADSQADGGRALAIPEGKGKGVGQAKVIVRVKQAGEYVLYARVRWDDGCSNSLRLVVGDDAAVLTDELFGRWHVVEAPRRVRLAAGAQTVVLQNLEDGIYLDWLAFRPAE
jgi:hypothetical protein